MDKKFNVLMPTQYNAQAILNPEPTPKSNHIYKQPTYQGGVNFSNITTLKSGNKALNGLSFLEAHSLVQKFQDEIIPETKNFNI